MSGIDRMPHNIESYYRQPELWNMDRYEGSADQRLRARMIAAMVPDDASSVLDVGCGNGFVTRRICAPRVVGLDPSPEALEHFDGEKVCASAEEIPFGDDSFDAVVCCEVLEHLPRLTLRRVVSEVERVARRAIVIGVPFDQDLRREMVECPECGERYHIDLHQNRFPSPQAVAELFTGWTIRTDVRLGSRERVRSNVFRTLSYHLLGPQGRSDFARCPECGSSRRKDFAAARPFRSWLFKGLGWRMPKEQLAHWMLLGLARECGG